MATKRKPKIQIYHTSTWAGQRFNWRLIAKNGEILCQCTQSFKDMRDLMRNVHKVTAVFNEEIEVWKEDASIAHAVVNCK